MKKMWFIVLLSLLIINVDIIFLHSKSGESPDEGQTSEKLLVINSPLNTTYEEGKITVEVSSKDLPSSMTISMDEGPERSVCIKCESFIIDDLNLVYNIGKGNHKIRIYAYYENGKKIFDEVIFTIV
jgi:hypothetical protein